MTTKTFLMRKHLLRLISYHANERRKFHALADYMMEAEHIGFRNAYLIVVNLYTKDND